MAVRPDALENILKAAQATFRTRAQDPRAQASLTRIFGALAVPAEMSDLAGARLPVCEHLSSTVDPSLFSNPALRRLAETFLRIEPALTWRRRGGEAPNASADFAQGHANAMLVGPSGLERRSDVWLGVSLVAPQVRYPDHHHAPEETYLVMSQGEFRQGHDSWFEPGVGGSFYNPPGILHAMRARGAPLFAFWALWAG